MGVVAVETENIHSAISRVRPGFSQIPAALIGNGISMGRVCLFLGVLGRYICTAVLAPWGSAGLGIPLSNACAVPCLLFGCFPISKGLGCIVLGAVTAQTMAVYLHKLCP